MRGVAEQHETGGGGGIPLGSRTVAVVEPRLLHAVPALRRRGPYEVWAKPLVDRAGAVLLLMAFAPVLAITAVVVFRALGRPVVLRQARVGRNGRVFNVYKFRTMQPCRRVNESVVERDRRLTHKHPNDPRLHPVGRFLRKWSLDELPQLLNVLRGEMSLVGPRPEMISVVQRHYEPWQHARHQVKPGLTGLWQVTERGGDEEMYKHTATDLRYVDNVSLWGDLKILLLTLPAAMGVRKGF